ncbi:hypothetical protein ACWTU6_30055 [Mesorhizobium sp. BHbsci]
MGANYKQSANIGIALLADPAEAHRWPRDRLAVRVGICRIILLPAVQLEELSFPFYAFAKNSSVQTCLLWSAVSNRLREARPAERGRWQ